MLKKLKNLISYYKPYKKKLIAVLFCSLISSIITLAIPVIVRYITYEVLESEINHHALEIIVFFTILMVVTFVIYYASSWFTKYFGKIIGSEIERDMYSELFQHYQKQSFSFFDDNNTGKLTAVMNVDVRNISQFLYHAPQDILSLTVKLIGAFVIFFNTNAWFGFTTIVIFILILAYVCYFTLRIQKIIELSHDKASSLSAAVEEALSGIRVIQSFANEKLQFKKFMELNHEYFENKKMVYRLDSILDSGLYSFTSWLTPIITLVSIAFIINGYLSINDVITYILYINVLVNPIFIVIGLIYGYQEAFVGYKRFHDILENKTLVTDSCNAINLENCRGDINFNNVSFRYQESDKDVLKDLNLEIKAGEYIALVGYSGSGKSTFCSLVPRFYDVSNGEILIDGINIKKIKLESLRNNIGFVQQDTFLFSGTIMDNIRYGKPNATNEEVIDAAKNAYIHDFAMNLTKGYDTQIGQRGFKLSGGQKQRLAIARIFLKNPKILIFDEATSSLDNENEKYIQASMERLSNNRTTIVIAHRLSTIRNAKRILIISNGKIAEEGTHKELLSKGGAYTNFYNLL